MHFFRLLTLLKPHQLESIKRTQAPPQRILAGAGNGRTTTITARIAGFLITCSLPHVLKIIGSYNFSLRDLFADAHPVSTVSATPYT